MSSMAEKIHAEKVRRITQVTDLNLINADAIDRRACHLHNAKCLELMARGYRLTSELVGRTWDDSMAQARTELGL